LFNQGYSGLWSTGMEEYEFILTQTEVIEFQQKSRADLRNNAYLVNLGLFVSKYPTTVLVRI